MCGPKLWNKLPLELRQKCSVESFKKGLKTHLFKEAYNIWTVLTYLKNVFYKYFRLLYFAFMYICILYSFMYACKILAPVLFHSCIAHWAVWNCALKEFIIIIIIIVQEKDPEVDRYGMRNGVKGYWEKHKLTVHERWLLTFWAVNHGKDNSDDEHDDNYHDTPHDTPRYVASTETMQLSN